MDTAKRAACMSRRGTKRNGTERVSLIVLCLNFLTCRLSHKTWRNHHEGKLIIHSMITWTWLCWMRQVTQYTLRMMRVQTRNIFWGNLKPSAINTMRPARPTRGHRLRLSDTSRGGLKPPHMLRNMTRTAPQAVTVRCRR